MKLTITECMVKDHKRIIDLFNTFKKVKNRNVKKAKEVFKKIDKDLRKHFKEEEKVIKAAFGKNNKERKNLLPIAASLKDQHNQIRNILTRISKSLNKTTVFIETYDLFLFLIRHKNVEEHLFYPKLDDVLPEKEKKKVIEVIKKK